VKPPLIGSKDRLIPKADIVRLLAFLDKAAKSGQPRPGWAPEGAHGPWLHFWRQSRLAVRVLLQSGLRCAEIARLKVRDCDTDTAPHRILVRGGKKRRADEVDEVRIPAGLAAEIDAWAAAHKLGPDDPLLRGSRGQHFSERWIYQLAKDPILAVGLNPKFATHHYRHRYATNLFVRTGDLLAVQKQLRHRSLQPTSAYLHMAASEEMMDDAMDGISLDTEEPPPRPRAKKPASNAALAMQLEQDRHGKSRRT